MKEPLNLFRRSLDGFGSRVHAVGAEQWGNRTPCDPWTVRDLVNHVVWAQSWTPPLLAGESVAQIGTRFDGDLLGESPAAAWDLVRHAAFAAAAGADLDRRLELVYGELSVREYLEFQIAELTIHAWDLARGIGADDRLDDELAAAVFHRYKSDRLYAGVAPGVGWSAMFKEPVDIAPEADPQSRLVAYVGRDPALH